MSEIAIDEKELPDSWALGSFEEIISPVKHAMKRGPFGSALKKSFFVQEGYKVYEQKNAIKDDSHLGVYFITEEKFSELENFKVGPGDFIVSCSGTIGRITRISNNAKSGIINQALLKIKINNEIINHQYFLYFFRSEVFQKQVLKETRGVAIKNIASVKDIKKLSVPLPPLEQQKQIVAKIEQLFSHIDAGIEALNIAKQCLKQYRQSVLKAAVTGELTKDWRGENKVSYGSWNASTIGEISLVQTSKTPKRSIEGFWKGGTIPWLTSSATNESLTHHADQFVTQAAVDAGLKLFEQGTLLLAMYGEGKTRGQVTEITFQAACNQACAAIIVDEKKAVKEYVRLRLNGNYEQTRKAASGGNQPNLNLSKVREILLPLPLLTEQAEIVLQVEKKFESIKRLENDLDTQLFKAKKTKQSILASAFSGKLTATSTGAEL